VKKDPEGNFLFLPFKNPKMPKSIKREVMRKEITRGGSTKFSKFQCKICQKYFCNKNVLNRHTERHFQPSNFECKRCEKVFIRKHNFDAHKCVKKSDRHFCSFCEKNFGEVKSLIEHLKKSHADNFKVALFHCDFCDKKFFRKKFLKFHLENFKCRTRQNFTCDHCGKEFEDKNKMSRHVKNHKTEKVECKICHAQVKVNSYAMHMSSVHTKEIFECKICKKILKNSQTLRLHQNFHVGKKFSCNLCDKKFRVKTRFNEHMKFHENPEQFKCQICGHQAKTKSDLKLHLRLHDKNREKNLKCDQCDFKTDRNKNLLHHKKVHEKLVLKLKNSPTAVKCEKCPSVMNKKFYEKHLKLQHGNLQKVQCDACGKEFTTKQNLKDHFFRMHLN
jgi:KRAB domain-containing zinc finger protein